MPCNGSLLQSGLGVREQDRVGQAVKTLSAQTDLPCVDDNESRLAGLDASAEKRACALDELGLASVERPPRHQLDISSSSPKTTGSYIAGQPDARAAPVVLD